MPTIQRFPNTRLVIPCTVALLSFGAAPRQAEACGGLFCSNTPVNQTEEGIIFDVDLDTNQVTAVINIVYQGSAPDFAWVLPLQANPTTVEVGSSQAFVAAQLLTSPRFQITEVEDVGVCDYSYFDDFALAGAESDATNAPPNARGGGVEVVQRDEVGPYDMVVLAGTDPNAIRTWLIDNQYRVTDEMMEKVVPYLAKGDVLLALKLLNNVDVGEITPIEVTMTDDPSLKEMEACIPIRLTAIAANTDMPITAYVFTDEGRAIPENFYHVVPNLLRIDWLSGGSNYRQLIAEAVDEADAGHAFVTEYAGSPSIFDKQVYDPAQYNLAALRAITDLGQFLRELMNQGLLRRQGARPILESAFDSVKNCPSCRPEQFSGEQIDAGPVVDALEERLLEPDRRAQQIMDRRSYFTRLLTMLDPDEMTIDPQFSYRSDLPDVSNVHNAKMIRYCGFGGTPGSAGIHILLEDGRTIFIDSTGTLDRTVLDSMPAAVRVEQLHERIVVQDNSGRIEGLLDEHNDRNASGGCGCGASAEKAGPALGGLAFAMVGLAFLFRRKRR